MIYEKHIFICTNQRKEGARKCCGEVHGMALVDAFKKKIKEHGLQNTIRAQKTGCFDICEYGPNIAVYPEGVFYGNVQQEDVEEIFNEHILNNRPVSRLVLPFTKKPEK
ncbi:MAG: Ferredoxin, 2Fe-2S [Bacteroidetes bacterium ADurb.Bin141]|nr:Ferredoxin, 2Fe-2S [Bacteroidia bacterium]MCB0848398.1 (2Fe-2S) ferredoxin domain-containing protein [Bacteroidota bacterium]MCB8931543.1 (2Fe-2S) ferredoxin domain-containing protein [Bacteroidia bacterium]OQB62685.1 MAG: Ferredoxin, 2Fe-2S [Bacteroidetes bacterium ADurb.Bin141]